MNFQMKMLLKNIIKITDYEFRDENIEEEDVKDNIDEYTDYEYLDAH